MIKRRVFLLYAVIMAGCRRATSQKSNGSSRREMLEEVRRLLDQDRRRPGLPESNRHIPPGLLNGSFTLVAGVWVEDGLMYEAMGVPLGKPPAGDDVTDRSPGIPDQIFSACHKCGRSWKWVEGHLTTFSGDEGMFPLCKRCWSVLTPAQRLPFYRQLFDQWCADSRTEQERRDVAAKWPLIERAVLAGL